MRKADIAQTIANHPRATHDAAYYAKRYTMAELVALAEAYTFADLYSPGARKLFDAVQWSRQLRTNKSLWLRVERTFGNANAQILH